MAPRLADHAVPARPGLVLYGRRNHSRRLHGRHRADHVAEEAQVQRGARPILHLRRVEPHGRQLDAHGPGVERARAPPECRRDMHLEQDVQRRSGTFDHCGERSLQPVFDHRGVRGRDPRRRGPEDQGAARVRRDRRLLDFSVHLASGRAAGELTKRRRDLGGSGHISVLPAPRGDCVHRRQGASDRRGLARHGAAQADRERRGQRGACPVGLVDPPGARHGPPRRGRREDHADPNRRTAQQGHVPGRGHPPDHGRQARAGPPGVVGKGGHQDDP
mmetsp:Transcript_84905/g.259238  ORF Transcript_84905/g.259238 Transcript_84905/m.259238 type:complete len:275 (+) Transcript_84905:76-900(+)